MLRLQKILFLRKYFEDSDTSCMNKIVQMIFRTFHFLKVKIINNAFTHIINVSKLAAETCVMKLIIIIIIFQLNKISEPCQEILSAIWPHLANENRWDNTIGWTISTFSVLRETHCIRVQTIFSHSDISKLCYVYKKNKRTNRRNILYCILWPFIPGPNQVSMHANAWDSY